MLHLTHLVQGPGPHTQYHALSAFRKPKIWETNDFSAIVGFQEVYSFSIWFSVFIDDSMQQQKPSFG